MERKKIKAPNNYGLMEFLAKGNFFVVYSLIQTQNETEYVLKENYRKYSNITIYYRIIQAYKKINKLPQEFILPQKIFRAPSSVQGWQVTNYILQPKYNGIGSIEYAMLEEKQWEQFLTVISNNIKFKKKLKNFIETLIQFSLKYNCIVDLSNPNAVMYTNTDIKIIDTFPILPNWPLINEGMIEPVEKTHELLEKLIKVLNIPNTSTRVQSLLTRIKAHVLKKISSKLD